jgi:putative cardiolipin synthase
LRFGNIRNYLLLLVFCSDYLLAAPPVPEWVERACATCAERANEKTGVYILEEGEEALLARAWLTRQATDTIDVQYFIWSTDNIGILASTELLAAAGRGVKVRVLVDDFLIDAEDKTLLALAAQENVEIRVYNPQYVVGTSTFQRLLNMIKSFRAVNQRMHDKTAIFDNVVGITGGRNMADEYFDYDHGYNFRDRDVLLVGKVVPEMTVNFSEFWSSELSVPVEDLLQKELSTLSREEVTAHHQMLREYARDESNFAPEVKVALNELPLRFPMLEEKLVWDDATFISDAPGKNTNRFKMDGGGETTSQLIEVLASARESVLIQTPYLVMPEGGIELLAELVQRGVRVRVSTNSLASTDNLMAFSGYYNQREKLLAAGLEIFEFRPDAAVRTRLNKRAATSNTIFAIHAKSMVVDRRDIYVGTFNLDPRSANLNTEVGILMRNKQLGNQLAESIELDLRAENSWKISADFNPDSQQPWGRRLSMWLWSILPVEALL